MTSISKKLNMTFGLTDEGMAAANSTFAIGGFQCSADTFFVNHNFVLRIKICGKSPAHRKSANRV
jgi:hypothetical protein